MFDVIECHSSGGVPGEALVFLARTEQGRERGERRGKMGLETVVENDEANEFTEFLGTGRL